ncbi:uncharacterized protein LOC105185126 [Harpegnathos saltator]|uniref:uncharacterized protein LOC105185126 n=1 Tax=Harpegnathos saltator TaxID=610380 RepID=UPI0005903235|nr:uncharacterized protein LOC105185126 [Harpegnathos saltator]XP_011142695.1 uncharacterized protein LOC105185126 [Harpegnathos saltator]XP_011142696.1 uncharacterized protein LOC105185126 [Harpegnathos saltator]XP_011142697.1 uncharacterized protein LOC105185126 [Harpegnathos saltator]
MGDQEQQCEDAVFEVCDARERFPQLCAGELENCIKLTNEIYMTKVLTKQVKTLDMSFLTDGRYTILEKDLSMVIGLLKMQDNGLQAMIDKIDNLKTTLEQIKKDKLCEINRLLRS